MKYKNRAVLYLRLSKEDVNKVNNGDDSASIKNQRLLLTDYAIDKGFEVVDVYSDDDFSGLYDDRPAFERLITDSKLGKFDIVIAKSQSRFTRNMEHMEKYLHHDFNLLGIRFIGVVDNVDTYDKTNKKSRQINGLVNEWYCEDLSDNIRKTLMAKKKDGQYVSSTSPYGYIKDEKNHNKLVIDNYSANIVRRIFNLYISGYGKAKIGSILSKDGVLIPTLYKKTVLGLNYNNANFLPTSTGWSYQTIHQIINNQTYIGNLVQHKCETISYKDKSKRNVPKDEWIIVKNTHEPIIDIDTWNKAQEIQNTKTRSVNGNIPNGLFSGKVYCADCKHAMSQNFRHLTVKERKYTDKKYEFNGYVCSYYKKLGKSICESHFISLETLETTLLQFIKDESSRAINIQEFSKAKDNVFIEDNNNNIDKIIFSLSDKLDKIKEYKLKTYESMIQGIISKQDFSNFNKKYDDDIKQYTHQINKLNAQKETIKDTDKKYIEWIENFSKYKEIRQLDRNIILTLIDKIEVNNDGTINIITKYKNPYK